MIRLLLVDDHASSREPLAILLAREPDIQVVGQAGSIAEARDMLSAVDVLVVDLNLPDGNGVDIIGPFRESSPDGHVLVLSGSTDDADRARAVEAGAIAVLNKATPLVDLVTAIRSVSTGEPLIPAKELAEMVRVAARRRVDEDATAALVNSLTTREREVVQALADGLSDKDIARQLGISTKTVRAHLTNILHKLGVSSRLQVLNFAVRHGLVDL